jgi:hypothetical protein
MSWRKVKLRKVVIYRNVSIFEKSKRLFLKAII